MLINKRTGGRRKSDIIYRVLSLIVLPIFVLLTCVYIYFIFFNHPATPLLSAHTINHATDIVDNNVNVRALVITKVDLKRNVRTILYTRNKDVTAKTLFEKFAAEYISLETPFMTDNERINYHMIKVLNHEMECYPYSESLTAQYMPEGSKVSSTICTMAIPPSYGEFLGMISIFLKDYPSDFEKDQIQTIFKDMSADVYEDLTKKK